MIAKNALDVHSGESKIDYMDGFVLYTYDGTNYLLGYNGTSSQIVLPSNYHGESYEIYKYAFFKCKYIENATISRGVTNIGYMAFAYNRSIKTIIIEKGILKMDKYVFYNTSVKLFYAGTKDEWELNDIDDSNSNRFSIGGLRFYSENMPDSYGYFWHYVDGIPTAW